MFRVQGFGSGFSGLGFGHTSQASHHRGGGERKVGEGTGGGSKSRRVDGGPEGWRPRRVEAPKGGSGWDESGFGMMTEMMVCVCVCLLCLCVCVSVCVGQKPLSSKTTHQKPLSSRIPLKGDKTKHAWVPKQYGPYFCESVDLHTKTVDDHLWACSWAYL